VKHALVTKAEGFVDAVLHKPQATTNQPTSTPELTLPATTPMIATTETPSSTTVTPQSTPGTPTLAPSTPPPTIPSSTSLLLPASTTPILSTPPPTTAMDLSQAFNITFDELAATSNAFDPVTGLYNGISYHGLLFKITSTINRNFFYEGGVTYPQMSLRLQPLSPPNFLGFFGDLDTATVGKPQTLALVPVSGTFSVLSIGRIAIDFLPSNKLVNVTYQGANEGGTCAGSLTIGTVNGNGNNPQDNIITGGCNILANFTITGTYGSLIDNILVVPGVGSSVNATAFM
jgi:hypothetical protein